MTPGIYLIGFRSNLMDFGSGLVVVDDGTIHGGDANYAYRGRYQVGGTLLTGTTVTAQIHVSHHTGPLNSVFGPLREFDLNLTGSADENSFTLSGPIAGHPQYTISIKGDKKAPLVT